MVLMMKCTILWDGTICFVQPISAGALNAKEVHYPWASSQIAPDLAPCNIGHMLHTSQHLQGNSRWPNELVSHRGLDDPVRLDDRSAWTDGHVRDFPGLAEIIRSSALGPHGSIRASVLRGDLRFPPIWPGPLPTRPFNYHSGIPRSQRLYNVSGVLSPGKDAPAKKEHRIPVSRWSYQVF